MMVFVRKGDLRVNLNECGNDCLLLSTVFALYVRDGQGPSPGVRRVMLVDDLTDRIIEPAIADPDLGFCVEV